MDKIVECMATMCDNSVKMFCYSKGLESGRLFKDALKTSTLDQITLCLELLHNIDNECEHLALLANQLIEYRKNTGRDYDCK